MASLRPERRPRDRPSGLVITLRALGLQAIAGLVVWSAAAVVAATVPLARLDLVDMLLLFGQLVVVPMGLLLFPPASPLADALQLNARLLFRVAALAALVAALLPQGQVAAIVAAVWLLPTGFAGLAALVHAIQLRDPRPAELARLASAGFLVAGAIFFVFHRAGLAPLGFEPVIIELTAVHFTFTGYGLLLVAAELAAWSRTRATGAPHVLGSAGALLLLVGLAVTPIGFVAGPVLQVIGAGMVAAAVLVLAGASLLVAARRTTPGLARPWLAVFPLAAAAVAMVAFAYAVSEAAGSPLLSIGQMAVWHGALAAFGVVGCGLLGWRLVSLLD